MGARRCTHYVRCCSSGNTSGPKELAEVVDEYKRLYRDGLHRELDSFYQEDSLKSAIKRAARAQRQDGKRYDHQRRIARRAIDAVASQLMSDHFHMQVCQCTSFDDLHDCVASVIGDIKGVRELMIYDTALRIGAKRGLRPTRVYLHRGARLGAKALGMDYRRPHIECSEVPPELRSLDACEIEDCLCIFKEVFRKSSITNGHRTNATATAETQSCGPRNYSKEPGRPTSANRLSMIHERLYARLRQNPVASSVPRSLPVLFFGDLLNARVATVGLNPSDREYVDTQGRELEGAERRFETLTSLCATDRLSLTDEQCDRAILAMRAYYKPGRPVYAWFRPLARVVSTMGFSYEKGEVAHLDLTQEATSPTWSTLRRTSPADCEALHSTDLPFLRWQFEEFPLHTVLCNGRTVIREVCRLIGGQMAEGGKLRRLTWYVGEAILNGRTIRLVGWNIPLARPTGLGATGERELGRILAFHLGYLADSTLNPAVK